MAGSVLRPKRLVWLLSYAPLFVWICVIFYLSSESGSVNKTSTFIRPFLEFLFPSATEDSLQNYHAYIRKLAHLSVYGILGILAARALLNRKYLPWRMLSMLLCAVVAILDETNQSFISTRTGSAYDVLIDCVGAIVGIALIWYVNRRYSTRNLHE